jgi:hypothetical protein
MRISLRKFFARIRSLPSDDLFMERKKKAVVAVGVDVGAVNRVKREMVVRKQFVMIVEICG